MDKLEDIEGITVNFNKEKHPTFGYTSMCGICKISEGMLDIVNEIPQLPTRRIDPNLYPKRNREKQITSVPALLLMCKEEEIKRIYAFQSATYLLENLK